MFFSKDIYKYWNAEKIIDEKVLPKFEIKNEIEKKKKLYFLMKQDFYIFLNDIYIENITFNSIIHLIYYITFYIIMNKE